jgi:hypothetical protein
VRAQARFLFSSGALQAKARAAGCTRAPVFLLLFTGAAQSMLCLKHVRRPNAPVIFLAALLRCAAALLRE